MDVTLNNMIGTLTNEDVLLVVSREGFTTSLPRTATMGKIITVDYNEETINIARITNDVQTSIEYRTGNIEDLELTQRFDIIIISEVLRYSTFPASKFLLTFCSKMLKIGGRIIGFIDKETYSE